MAAPAAEAASRRGSTLLRLAGVPEHRTGSAQAPRPGDGHHRPDQRGRGAGPEGIQAVDASAEAISSNQAKRSTSPAARLVTAVENVPPGTSAKDELENGSAFARCDADAVQVDLQRPRLHFELAGGQLDALARDWLLAACPYRPSRLTRSCTNSIHALGDAPEDSVVPRRARAH